MRNASLGLLPDLVGGCAVVGFPVRIIRVLIGVEILVRMCCGKLAGHANGTVGSVSGVGVNDVCTVSLQDLLTLTRNVFRHAEGDRKSFCRTEHRIGDAGVAAGRVEKNLAGAELAAAASFSDNIASGAVLHRTAGVVPFGLAQKCLRA